MSEEQEEVARPARIAVPMIDQSVGTNEEDATGGETTDVPLTYLHKEDVRMRSILSRRLLKQSPLKAVQTDTTHTDEININVEQKSRTPVLANRNKGDLDSPIATVTLMSEEWTYDEGEHSQGGGTVLNEPQVPESNPKHEAIRSDILASD